MIEGGEIIEIETALLSSDLTEILGVAEARNVGAGMVVDEATIERTGEAAATTVAVDMVTEATVQGAASVEIDMAIDAGALVPNRHPEIRQSNDSRMCEWMNQDLVICGLRPS